MPTTSKASAATQAVYVGQHVRVTGGVNQGIEGRVVSIATKGDVATIETDYGRYTEPVRWLTCPADLARDTRPNEPRTKMG